MQQELYQKLLAIHDKLFDLTEYQTISDFIVNDSFKVVPYQLAVLYEAVPGNSNSYQVSDISGTLDQEIKQEFKYWLDSVIGVLDLEYNKKENKIDVIHPEQLTNKLRQTWPENLGQDLVILNLYKDQGQIINLVLFNNRKYDNNELISLNFLVKCYNQAITINIKSKQKKKKSILKSKPAFFVLLMIFIGSMFVPVTPSVMAPAEIISEKTWAINAPITGVIKDVAVEPNTTVKKNTVLFSFDHIDLSNNLKLKEQELEILKTDQNQARALGFDDKEQRAKIFRIKQDIMAKEQEVFYAKQQLDLSQVKAPASGTVLFKSKNDFLGKPAKIGETIMRLADVTTKEIEVWLDINDSLALKSGMNIFYYSNQAPFTAVDAELSYYSYEAYITPQNKIAYRLIAKLKNNNNQLIIGDHGQVKIYGLEKVSLGRFLFQRPLAKLRQWLYKAV